MRGWRGRQSRTMEAHIVTFLIPIKALGAASQKKVWTKKIMKMFSFLLSHSTTFSTLSLVLPQRGAVWCTC
jgi:hypothetical protein